MQSAQRKYDVEIKPYPAQKRVVKMQGNVAYISIDPERPVIKRQPVRPAHKTKTPTKAKTAQSRNTKAAAKAEALRREQVRSRRNLISTLFVVFAAFCALCLLVSRYALVCSINLANNGIKDKIETLEAQIDRLSLDMELKSNVEEIRKKAQDELHMAYPRQDQKISINMSG